MTENEKLELESRIGRDHADVYARLIEPYFAEKQLALYAAFTSADSANKEVLQLIKLQSNALEGLRQHFLHFIETGKLAELKLTEVQNNG